MNLLWGELNMILVAELRHIRSLNPCAQGWYDLLRYLQYRDREDDTQITLKDIFYSQSTSNLEWFFKNVEKIYKLDLTHDQCMSINYIMIAMDALADLTVHHLLLHARVAQEVEHVLTTPEIDWEDYAHYTSEYIQKYLPLFLQGHEDY